ncbi:MAG: 30S ribosomal protein S4 [Candidatus Berkelbacteria bacterium]|nr:30S ribosomal protein S4 [Candidatus Berkelbacteria bacterium]
MADEEIKTEKAAQTPKDEEIEKVVSSEPKGAGLRFIKSKGVCRKCRRAGEKLFLKGERCFSAKCSFTRRSYIPGQHGNKRPSRLSQYGLQLREKQKLAAIYGVRERQLLKYFKTATNKKGKTGDILMTILERRLDNVVYRAGFASSRRQARQKVNTRRISLNDRSVDIPSILVKKDDMIKIKEEKTKERKEKEVESKADIPKWFEVTNKDKEIKVLRLPDRTDIGEPINEQLVVEFYSK